MGRNIRHAREEMQRVMKDHSFALDVITRPDLGGVSFYWGDEKAGLAHIIQRRMETDGYTRAQAEALCLDLVEVVAKGRPVKNTGGKITVELGGKAAVLALYKDGEKMTWLLSGFQVTKKGSGATEAGRSAHGATPNQLSRRARKGGADKKKSTPSPKPRKANPAPAFGSRERTKAYGYKTGGHGSGARADHKRKKKAAQSANDRAEELMFRLSTLQAEGGKLTKAQVKALARAEKRLQDAGALPDDAEMRVLAKTHQAQERALDAVLGPSRETYAVKLALENRPFHRADLEALQAAGWVLRSAGTVPAQVGKALAALNPTITDEARKRQGAREQAKEVREVVKRYREKLKRLKSIPISERDPMQILGMGIKIRELMGQARQFDAWAKAPVARVNPTTAIDRILGRRGEVRAVVIQSPVPFGEDLVRELQGDGYDVSPASKSYREAPAPEESRQKATGADTERRKNPETGPMRTTTPGRKKATSTSKAKASVRAKKPARTTSDRIKRPKLNPSIPKRVVKLMDRAFELTLKSHQVMDAKAKASAYEQASKAREAALKAILDYPEAKGYLDDWTDIHADEAKRFKKINTTKATSAPKVGAKKSPARVKTTGRAAIRFNPESSEALAKVWKAWTGSETDKVMQIDVQDPQRFKLPAQVVMLGRVAWLATKKGEEKQFGVSGPYMVTDGKAERIWLVSSKAHRFDLEPALIGYLARKPKFGDKATVEYIHAFEGRAHAVMNGQVGALTGTFRITPAGLEG